MSWSAETWASSGGQYSDTLFAPSTKQTVYDDYTGRAVFYKSASESSAENFDLLINSLEYTINEHIKFEQAIGNNFMYVPFGKDELKLQLSGFLVDSGKNPGKDQLMDFYRNYLRLEAAARRGTTPILVFPDAAFYCAASAMTISETSESEDTLSVTMTLVVTAATFTSSDENFMLDYVHGVEVSGDSILNTELTQSSSTSTTSASTSTATVVDTSSKNSTTTTTTSSSSELGSGVTITGETN